MIDSSFNLVSNTEVILGSTESRMSHINLHTADRRFILQSISKEEKKYFLEYMVEQYHKRVTNSSLVQHIYGLFKLIIRGKVLRYIILENPLYSLIDPIVMNMEWNQIYPDDYSIDSSNLSTLLKYLENTLGIEIHLNHDEFQNLSNDLIADLEFINNMKLKNFNVTFAYSKYSEVTGATGKTVGTVGDEKSVIILSLSNLLRYFPKAETEIPFGSFCINQKGNIIT